MAFFRRTFSRRNLPDRFQEITERVYVFDCCLTTKDLAEQDYKSYMNTAVTNLQRHHPGASFMVFNFKEGDDPSLLSDLLSHHDMTVVDYPRHYEGYPILPLEMIHYFLRSSDSWLSLEGQRNVILMHCERGGWPVLAFMLAGLLLYSKKQLGEMKTLEMVLKQAPKELLTPLSIMNPSPSQLRYLEYISNRSLTSDWPPSDAPLVVESVVLMNLPLFDGGKGCRPVVHVYGQDSSMTSSRSPRLLCSSLMSEEGAHYYKKEECLMVKINLNCRVQGDVFLECIHLGDDLVSEEKIFKVMFHTAFVQSYIMLLSSSEVDVLWNANAKIPNDFKAEVFFSNPEEVQFSIAKEMASLESGHESESEFFEAEEFEISIVDNNDDKEIMHSNYILDENLLDHYNEDKQEKLLVKSNENHDPEASFDVEEKNKHKIEATVSQEQNTEQAPEFDYEPIQNLSDERDSYRVTEVDFHPSAKGDSVLVDYEQVVTNENILEVSGSKVEDTSQTTTLPISCSEEEYDLKQAKAEFEFESCSIKNNSILVDFVKQSQEGGSEKSSSQVVFEANTNVVLIEEITKDDSTSATIEANAELNNATKSFLLLEENQEDSLKVHSSSKAQFDGSEDFLKASPLEVRFDPNIVVEGRESEPIIVSKSIVVTEGSEDDSKADFPKSSSKTNMLFEESQDIAETTSDEAGLELNSANKNFLAVEEKLEDCSTAESMSKIEVEERSEQDFSKASPSQVRFEPKMVVVEGCVSEPMIVSKNIMVTGEGEISSKIVSPKTTSKATSSEAGLELNNAGKSFLEVEESFEHSSRAEAESNIEAEERSEQDSSEVCSSEIESENCVLSKSFISTEGSEDSSEAASSQTGSEFLAAQATSSEAKPEPNNSSKHIVVMVEDNKEHDVKVQVQPKSSADGGSKGVVHQKVNKNKKKPRLADAVAKVTMQKRVISMWVPRDKQSNPEDMKHKAPVYKWIPKESVSASEEA